MTALHAETLPSSARTELDALLDDLAAATEAASEPPATEVASNPPAGLDPFPAAPETITPANSSDLQGLAANT